MNTDLQTYAAQVQARLAFIAIYALIGITVLVLIACFLPITPNDKMITLAITLGTALITLASGGYGFWLARHRPNGQDGSDGNDASSPLPSLPSEKPK